MLTALFLVWLQMSAQPRSGWQNCITVNNMPCARAADETDGKPLVRKGESYQCGLNPGLGGPKFCVAEKDIYAPKAEPVDVPAVQVTEDTSDTWWSVPSTGDADVQVKGVQRRWTCADKSRVLLTSEDGKKHCVKF